jgi:hypothetical protein
MNRKFAILLHTGHGPTHLDLLLEAGEALASWQLPDDAPGLIEAGAAAPAHRIQDHRRVYLEYEGPVSGNRGSVRSFDRGEFRLVSSSGQFWELDLAGRRLRGRYCLRRIEGDRWEFYRQEGPSHSTSGERTP